MGFFDHTMWAICSADLKPKKEKAFVLTLKQIRDLPELSPADRKPQPS